MSSQLTEEFLLGYRAGHRDGFADAIALMRDAVAAGGQMCALAAREEQLAQLLSRDGLLLDPCEPQTTNRTPSWELLAY